MISNQNIVGIARIPSRLYYALFKEGSDNLLSVYCTLKKFKGEKVKFKAYKSKNNKFVSGYSLLRSGTNISLATLRKYVPVLINMGLISFEKNGDVSLLGNNKIKRKYGNKIVPVAVCIKLTDTRYSCMSVRIHSKQEQQSRMIEKKANLRELLLLGNRNVRNLKQLKALNRAKRKYGNDISKLNFTDQTVLSIQGFNFLKNHTENNKSLGNYYKRKLKQKGLVDTTRRFKLFSNNTTLNYSDYKFLKSIGEIENKYLFKNNRLVEEIISSFTNINIVDRFNIYSSFHRQIAP